MKKRAQAAMEFLMTYGWAILVVLIVIGALSYFGVLDPTSILPDKCTLQTGLYCEDHLVKDNMAWFLLQNGLGKDIRITNINISEKSAVSLHSCEWIAPGSDATGIENLSNGQSILYNLSVCSSSAQTGSKYKWDIELSYIFAGSSLEHTMSGELFTRIEEP